MGKKSKRIKPAQSLPEPTREPWEIDWNSVKTWEDVSFAIREMVNVLRSNLGNRDEDVLDHETSGGISDTSDSDLDIE